MDEINYAKGGIEEAALREIITAAGSVSAVLNGRHATAKERGWTAEEPPSEEEFIAAALEEPNLLRRPIFIRGKTVLIGFDKSNRERWAKLA